MRIQSHAFVPAMFAALLLLLTLQPMSAQDMQATPIPEQETPIAEPDTTKPASRSSMNEPQQQVEPSITYTHSPEILGLPNPESFHFTFDYDFEGYDFQVPVGNVVIYFHLTYAKGYGHNSITGRFEQDNLSGTFIYNDEFLNPNLNEDCIANSGEIKATMHLSASANWEEFYTSERFAVEIPCSATVRPEVPVRSAESVCGPGNDKIYIPEQSSVVVNDTDWVGTSRTITYTPAAWALFPDDFDPEFVFTDDDDECAIQSNLRPPIVGAICGIGNDTITPAASQPVGVNTEPDSISAWSNGEATLTYSAANGYYFPGGISNVIAVQELDQSGQCFESAWPSVADGAFQNVSLGDSVPVTIWFTLDENHSNSTVIFDFLYNDEVAPGGNGQIDLDSPPERRPYSGELSMEMTDAVLTACEDGEITLTPRLRSNDEEAYFFGTPATYPCSVASSSTEPTITYDYPESIGVLPGADYYFTIGWDLTDVDFQVPDNHITLQYSFMLSNNDGWAFSAPRLVDAGRVGQFTFDPWNVRNVAANNCRANEGHLTGVLDFSLTNNQTQETLWAAEPHAFDIPCSATVVPTPPADPVTVCGPGNDIINIPEQPNGVTVSDTGWVNGERTITYDDAEWAIFPDGFERTYTYIDDDAEECEPAGEPTASITGPETLYLLEPDSQVTVTASYDLADSWSDAGPVRADVFVDMDAAGGAGLSYSGSASIDTQSGEFSITSALDDGNLIGLCMMYNGNIPIGVDVQFRQQNSNGDWVDLWSYESSIIAPCTSEVFPIPPTDQVEVCGPNNDMIEIPEQPPALSVQDSGWNDNHRTITYHRSAWMVFPEGFQTTYNYTDEAIECIEPSAALTGPETLHLLEPESQITVSATYDLADTWPGATPVNAYVQVDMDAAGGAGLRFSGAATIVAQSGEFSVTSSFDDGHAVALCNLYAGNIPVVVDIQFHQQNDAGEWVDLWSYQETIITPCTVALTPLPATINDEVCGYNDQRINVPEQQGIASYSITWEDNIATINYVASNPYGIAGGPYTLTVTADPCVAELMDDPIHNPVCGIDNDEIVPGDAPDGVLLQISNDWNDGEFIIRISALPGWVLHEDQQTEYLFEDEGDCVIEGLTAPIHTQVCGENNDLVELPPDQDHVTITSIGDMANDGSVTVTLTPDEHHMLPDGIDPEYTFVDEGDCLVTPIPPDPKIVVCGPNNDIIPLPEQPEGVIVEDSGWEDNVRAISFSPADNYVFPDNTPRNLLAFDEATECEVDPVGTTLIVNFETSDGGSIEGATYSLYAPVASQVAPEPFIEGEIGPGNQIIIEELIAGTYRLVTSPEGYEPIDVTFEVTAEEASEQQVIAVAALQPVVTPTPEPTVEPTVVPTIEPTADATPTQVPTEQPLTPTEETEPVTGLPETGSGSGGGFGMLALAGLLAAMVLGVIGNRRRLQA